MNAYEEKQARRKERLEARAAKLESEAQQKWRQGEEMASVIPFGQPILVGHHSEGRDRSYRKRIARTFDNALELHKAAEAAGQRAASAGTGGISSDDPDAIDKIAARIAEIEEERDRMKAINAAWRKAGRPATDDDDGWAKVADAIGKTSADAARISMTRQPWSGAQPVENYELSLRSANIRRLRARVATLDRQAKAEPVERMIGDVRVEEDPDDNRLRLYFPGKPDAETRATLKAAGFRWAPSVGAWQRQLNNAARYAAERVLRGSRSWSLQGSSAV